MEEKGSVHISVVTPIYGYCASLRELYLRLVNTLETINPDFEIIMVNDGSPDDVWERIVELAQKDKRVKGISLSRNFGQHYAISAGLDHCKGEWVVVMDCDLQDQPEEIIKLYQKAQEGYEIILASRSNRKDSFVKKLFSKLFYFILSFLTGSEQDESVANFGIYSQRVVTHVRNLRESIRYFPTMIQWVGFKSTKVSVEHAQRKDGVSGYRFKKMAHLAIDIMLAFSDKPLRMTVKLGFGIALISFVFGISALIKWLNGEVKVLGWASLITSIWFLTGCILITLGIVGLYVGKIFEGVKNRPIYIIEKYTYDSEA